MTKIVLIVEDDLGTGHALRHVLSVFSLINGQVTDPVFANEISCPRADGAHSGQSALHPHVGPCDSSLGGQVSD